MHSYEKLAKILRTDKDNLRLIDEQFGALTGKREVMDKIIEDNEFIIKNRLAALGLTKNSGAKEVYDALIKKIKIDDDKLFELLGKPSAVKTKDWEKVLTVAKEIAKKPKGFFLKTEKAAEFLKNCPPLKVLRTLEYNSIEEMLGKEDIFEIYSSLRFVEGSDWLNSVFFKQYENLKPSDFEEREIVTRALPEKWAILAQDFIRKKHHNISHLKELGVIYVIPLALDISGETMRNFSLILHYFNEIPFYSSLFKQFSNEGKNFVENLISLLRGDVIDRQLPVSKKIRWLVIQRYLAKDDENDWRLSAPHINPEALHWERAERLLVRAGETLDGFPEDFFFWQNLNWAGDYFKSDAGVDVLVSFNLVDTAMSLVKSKEMIKYLYHHQESLWNKIFTEYFGEEEMEKMMKENIIRGWFEV
ncbi:MAG: hypothetical protein AAB366_02000 [Patescibacteria group bacterium]